MKNRKGKASQVKKSTVKLPRTKIPKDPKPVGSSKTPVRYEQPKGKPYPKYIQPKVKKSKKKKT